MNTSIQTTVATLAAIVAVHIAAVAATGTALQARADSAMLPIVKAEAIVVVAKAAPKSLA
jgi:cytochrome b